MQFDIFFSRLGGNKNYRPTFLDGKKKKLPPKIEKQNCQIASISSKNLGGKFFYHPKSKVSELQ